MTKQDRKLIAKIAKSLPPMVHKNETVKRVVHGVSVLSRNPDAKVGNSNDPVKSNKLYIAGDEPKSVNHRKELEKMFVKFGEVGLATYQKQILTAAYPAK